MTQCVSLSGTLAHTVTKLLIIINATGKCHTPNIMCPFCHSVYKQFSALCILRPSGHSVKKKKTPAAQTVKTKFSFYKEVREVKLTLYTS